MATKLPVVPRIKLGSQGLEVSAQGLGCMGMSFGYGPPKPQDDMIELLRFAVDSGITFLDTADVYGPLHNEILLGKALKGIRSKAQVATKFGICRDNDQHSFRGDPAYVRASCEESLKRLDVDFIDLYFVHRIDKRIPIEVTVGEMKKLLEEGKIKYLGLSDASASTIRRAHAVHPISAIQLEWSLWTRDAEQEVIPTCRELGIGIVPYSPLGRGFLAAGANVLEGVAEDDKRKKQPRFDGNNFERNLESFRKLHGIASRKSCTPGRVALAWLQHQGDDVAPIPGITKQKNLRQNMDAFNVKLAQEDLQEIERIFHINATVGDRYGDMSWTTIDCETGPLSEWQGA